MRIAGTSYNDSMTTQINALSAKQYQLQNEATTGQRVQAPEDDPAAMAEALSLQAQNSAVGQYSQNVTTLQNRATLVGNALSQLQGIVSDMTDITTQSGDFSTDTERQANAATVTQKIEQAVNILNSKDGDQYLFGGTSSGQPPFALTKDANGNVTGVTYQGNTSTSESEIGQNTTLSVDIPGENTTGSGARGLVADSRYGADLFSHMISLQNDLQSGNTTAITTTDNTNLNADSDNIIYQVGSNGATQARLVVAASAASTQQSSLTTALTNVAGADLTTTLTQLTQAQNSYQIALQSTSTIMQLQTSLLSYLA